jgi:hypothetical protein
MAAATLLDELAAIWAAVPLPGEQWHPWVAELRRLDRDVRTAVAVLAEDADARSELEAVLEAGDPAPDDGRDGLGEALRLLAELPRPVGHHPFLHAIAPGSKPPACCSRPSDDRRRRAAASRPSVR